MRDSAHDKVRPAEGAVYRGVPRCFFIRVIGVIRG